MLNFSFKGVRLLLKLRFKMEKMIKKKKMLKLSGRFSFLRLKMTSATELTEERAQIKVFRESSPTN